MFKPYTYKIAVRYFFSKDKKTIVNRINGFAFFMIVSAACVLLLVLSGFAGLKDFGLTYTSSFDPELKIVPKTGSYFVISQDNIDMIKGIEGVLDASPVIEEKVALSNEINSGAVMLKGVYDDYYMGKMLDSLSLIGAFSPGKQNAIYLGADLASSLEVVMSDDFSLLATAAKKNSRSLFSFSPFNTRTLDIEGVYQISSDIENKFAFTSLKTLSSLMGMGENSYTSIEVVSDGSVNKSDLEKEVNALFASNFSVLDKQDLNPALYKMLNTENIAVYLIFSLVALISMFNLVGSITIMMVEKRKDLRVLEILGGQKKDFNNIFFSLGVFTTVFGTGLGVGVAWLLITIQNFYSFVYVPGTSIPYPVSLTTSNVIIVFTTIVVMGIVTSAWSSRSNTKA
jgi:lipoprotein-releasing system permease protein